MRRLRAFRCPHHGRFCHGRTCCCRDRHWKRCGGKVPGMDIKTAGSFYEDDEDPVKVFEAFDAGLKGLTGPGPDNPAPMISHGVFHDFRSGIITLRAPDNASIRVMFLTRQGAALGVLNARPGEVREAAAWADLYQVQFTPVPDVPVPAKKDTA